MDLIYGGHGHFRQVPFNNYNNSVYWIKSFPFYSYQDSDHNNYKNSFIILLIINLNNYFAAITHLLI